MSSNSKPGASIRHIAIINSHLLSFGTRRGLCKACAPDLAVEISAQQANRALKKFQTGIVADSED